MIGRRMPYYVVDNKGIIKNGLVFRLPMEDTPGSTVYDSVGGMALANSGATLSTDIHPTGKNVSWNFGSSTILTFTLGEALANVFNSSIGSVMFWGYRNGTVDGQFLRIIEYHNSGTWRLSQGATLNPDWFSGARYWTPGAALSTSAWYHLAMVSESTNSLKFYVNGTLNNTNTSSRGTPSISPSYNSGYIGKGCCLSDVRIYKRALTADEIMLIYSGGK